MGDDKVKESPAEVFATVTEVNSLFHSLEDMLATRFEAIDGKFGIVVEKFAAIDGRFGALEKNLAEMDARNGVQFAALEQMIVELDTKTEGRFDPVAHKLKTQTFKFEQRMKSIGNRMMFAVLLTGGMIIATILHGG